MEQITILLFGASGDLAKRKLIPALYTLFLKQKYNFILIGIGKEEKTIETIFNNACSFIHKPDKEQCAAFLKQASYYAFDIHDKKECTQFAKKVEEIEKKFGFTKSIRIAYCATASQIFIPITNMLFSTQLIRHIKTGFHDRIVYEKPFGTSKIDAQHINQAISTHFDEKQIFRVDHYLTKELVQSIINVRFSNALFEPLLNNQFVEEVQIIANENIGVEGRISYYDHYGAIKDMIQNHLLSLLSLISLEHTNFSLSNALSLARQEIIKYVSCDGGILGQYKEYAHEVGHHTKTETFAALTFFINNNRWKDVPFFIKTGKNLHQKETVIYITFKQPKTQFKNILTLKMSPKAIFSLSINIKAPGKKNIISIPLEFCHSCIFAAETPEAYEVLLHEVLSNDQSITVSKEEIEASWDIAEKIIQKNLPLYHYKKGSNGPEELKEFEKKYNMQWKS